MLFFLSLLLFSSVSLASDVEILCGNTNEGSQVLSSMDKVSKYRWCMIGVCEENSKKFEREKCVRYIDEDNPAENAFLVSHSEVHRDTNLYASKGKAGFYRLYPGDSCFEECRPFEKKTFLGLGSSKKLGLENKKCAQCLMKLPVVDDSDSYEVVGHGVKVYKGQKCHGLCRLPEGPYLDYRPYSSECLNCIGVEGIKPVFEYLIDMSGNCYELREGAYQGVSKVPEMFCKENTKIHGTYYKKASKFSMATLIFKEEPKCSEVDTKSNGKYFNRQVDTKFCDPDHVNDDQRGNSKDSSSPAATRNSSSGARRN